jgi:glutathione S-transferase
MYQVYGMSASGNCHKVKMLLAQLGLPYRWTEIDIFKGESRTAAFLAMNRNGKTPVLEIEPGQYLPESNAILCYLADGTRFWPDDRYQRADILHWLFFEQYSHEPYIAVARFILKWLPADHPRRAELPKLHERGRQALAVMAAHLAERTFFVAERYTIADIALFAYTRAAGEGGFDLADYPAIGRWLARVEAQPGYVAMR